MVVETAAGLVLVDTGLGARDLVTPVRRLGPVALLMRTEHDPAASAVAQIRALGYTGVAVQVADGWLLHAGDAYYDHQQLEGRPLPPGLRVFEAAADRDHARARANIARLRQLREEHGDRVRVFRAHDPAELAAVS